MLAIALIPRATLGSRATAVLTVIDNDKGLTLVGDRLGNTLIGTAVNDFIDGREGNDTLFGNGGDDTILGGVGIDILDGGTGADSMMGGAGNDTYYVDNTGDIVIEDVNSGSDTVYASINYILTDNVENLNLLGSSIIGSGNNLNNIITGNDGDNIIDGKAGADRMVGGNGNDIYYVDNVGDTIVEVLNAGIDTIYASIDYSLLNVTNVENSTLLGTGKIATGNIASNILNGNDLDNTLFGRESNDTIYGGDGNDTLNGGAGADIMIGGRGDDTYFIDDIGDIITEATAEGLDNVITSINYVLTTSIENLTMTGSAITGTGNSLNNTITGNSLNNQLFGLAGDDNLTGNGGNDTLDGGLGNDMMVGSGGNDYYIVDSNSDLVVELAGQGTDTVEASIDYTLTTNLENLVLTANAVKGTGNDGNNIIIGNTSNNILIGGLGNDTYTGGAGIDTFVLNAPRQGIDVIKDFISSTDFIAISASGYGSGLIAGNSLISNQLRIGAGATTANNAVQRFIFNTTNGNLYFDIDGIGGIGAVQVARIENTSNLNNTDFRLMF
jgi:trimeric autotransporter adhesin